MSEYWKSTPKYWCKHCATFIRDTKLERANHESTAKHQSAIKRSLRDIHRNAENQEREKERARREIDRLNGVVSKPSSSATGSGSRTTVSGATAAPKQMTEAERQKQLESLAELGVSIPDQLRGNMAMAGEWTVTNVKVVEEEEDGGDKRVVGVKRERERTEEEKEAEEAIRGLFDRKRRRWGRDSKVAGEEDGELEALLSGPLVKKEVKGEVKEEVKEEEGVVKQEEGVDREVKREEGEQVPAIKKEPSSDDGLGDVGAQNGGAPEVTEETPAVVFKKRKPKNVRQK